MMLHITSHPTTYIHPCLPPSLPFFHKVLDKAKIVQLNMGKQVKKEISIMKLIRHPSVVSLVEVLVSKTKIFIVLQLVTGGELFEAIAQ
jgi:5'-AMP-activated protein kinase catalytic alpha subunit